ncbi:MAG: hypothetical protein CMN34_07800 [Saprospirales bacterium]|nr:hypothetical protein [Saprospirales bacterium]
MEAPSNPEVDLSSVPPLGALDFTAVSEDYRTLRIIQWSVVQLILALSILAPVFISTLFNNVELSVDFGDRYWRIPLLVQGVVGGFWLVEEWLGFPRRGYVVRERDITYRSGWFSRSTTTIPYSQVQHIELTQGLIARWFGLKHLKLFTAGGSGNLRIAGIEEADAQVLRSILDSRTGKG